MYTSEPALGSDGLNLLTILKEFSVAVKVVMAVPNPPNPDKLEVNPLTL